MKRSFFIKTILALLLCGGAAALLSSRRAVFDGPDADRDAALREIAEQCRATGMVRALSFDGPFLRDWATGTPVEQTETEAVEGVRDGARRFRPERDSFVDPAIMWASLPTNGFSFLLRMRLATDTGVRKPESPKVGESEGPEAVEDQDICFADGFEQKTGLAIRGGELCFYVPTAEGFARLSAPAPKAGRYVSVLAVVDGEAGRAALYLDGEERDARDIGAVRLPRRHLLFRTETWHPPRVDLDEFALWNRPLPAAEAAAVARNGFHPAEHAAATAYRRYRRALARGRILRGALRAVERFDPTAMAYENDRLPLFTLRAPTSVRRKLVEAHDRSLRNGERTHGAGVFRPCRLVTPTGAFAAHVCLDDVYADPRRCRRPSYIVSLDGRENDPDAIFRLYPPEDHPVLHAGDPLPIPLDDGAYVRFSVNGALPSVYCLEPLVRVGNARLSDFRRPHARSPVRASPIRPVLDIERLGEEAVRARFRECVRRIVADPRSEWGTREWKIRARRHREEAGQRPATSELDALGANEAPFWIETDLALTNAAFAGVARWRSSRPELIDGEGRVHRPEGDLPQVVELVPEGADGAPPAGVPSLRFRVVPERPRLGALMVYVSTPVRKIRRGDFVAVWHPAGGGEPRVLRGMGGTGGGIRHRGNTSYVQSARKPFSLKFDAPLDFLGSDGRILHLYSGYADASRMRSRLSMDSFRLMGEGGRPHHECEKIGWMEVFLNGQYYGVYEAGTQDNREMLPADSTDELFKLNSAMTLFQYSGSQNYLQLRPRVEEDSREASLPELMDAILDPDDEAFRTWALGNLDLDNVADFMLLLNYSGNYDGVYANLCIGREGDGARRFYILPRDYDRSFFPGKAEKWMTNRLDARLRRCVPEYREKMAARWTYLRRGPFSDEAIADRVDAYARELDGYMEEDYRLLGMDADFAMEARTLRDMAVDRLHKVDREVVR